MWIIIVLIHKMGFDDCKNLNGKKREEVLNLFQDTNLIIVGKVA